MAIHTWFAPVLAAVLLVAALAGMVVVMIEKPLSARAGCVCTKQYAPVCDAKKNKYANSCMARCAGVKSFSPCT